MTGLFSEMKKIYIVDGFNLIFRSFYAIRGLSRKDGFPTNALHGWVRSLWKLQDEPDVARLMVVFDVGEDEFRKNLLPEYKAQRKETPEDLLKQIPVIKEMTRAMGIPGVYSEGIEADDIIATLAATEAKSGDHEVNIVSADKDLAQCVGERIFLLLPPPSANAKSGWKRLDASGVIEKFGVGPHQIPDYLALIGDTADNIKGLPGVGPKTAAKWLQSFGSLEEILVHHKDLRPPRFAPLVEENQDLLRRNLQLTTLRCEVSLPPMEIPTGDFSDLFRLLEEMEMKKALEDARERYGQGEFRFT